MIPDLYIIKRKIKETYDTFTLELEPEGGNIEFTYSPGQFNMLYMFGFGEVPISLCGNPDESKTLKHTIRTVGAITKGLQRLKKGDTIGVRGPFGNYWPLENATGNDIILVAGGIGLAPLRPAIYRLISLREKYGKIVILYGTRTPDDLLYKRELENWRKHFDIEVKITVDKAINGWSGNVGVVTTLIPKIKFDPYHTTAMICGPEIMMRFTIKELHNFHVSDEDIFISMERNMKCGLGLCGHCQFGPFFVCKDGPVFRYDRIKEIFGKQEI